MIFDIVWCCCFVLSKSVLVIEVAYFCIFTVNNHLNVFVYVDSCMHHDFGLLYNGQGYSFFVGTC